jgi:hypothetical protein
MRRALLLLLLAASAPAGAADVYKCIGADGAVGFQDHPCAATARQQRLTLPDVPPPTQTAPAAPPPEPPPEPPAAPPASAPTTPSPAPAETYLCTRYDGTRYLSDDGIGARHAVPYAMLGGAGMSLAEAYGGSNGIGVSAPGLRPVPTLPAAQNPIAGAYVWVEDACRRIRPEDACAYLRGELDEVERKLRRAFSDTEAQLRDQAQALRERMRGC